jgi:hypothetical protein
VIDFLYYIRISDNVVKISMCTGIKITRREQSNSNITAARYATTLKTKMPPPALSKIDVWEWVSNLDSFDKDELLSAVKSMVDERLITTSS